MDQNEASSLRVQLYSEGTTIRSIAAGKIKENKDPTREDPEDPLVIFDIGDVIAKDNKWRTLLPSVETFFALKCNHDPVMVKLMIELGRGFDCASKKEIQLVLDAGASPDKIVFAYPYKQESHLRFAKEKGVRLMTFDTEEELHKVKRVYPEAGLVLRVAYNDVTATFPLTIKFGCREGEWRHLMELAVELDLNIEGISFHVGSEGSNPQVFDEAIQYARPMFDFGRSLGFTMNLLDIGGGFPGRIHPKTNFEEFAEIVGKSLEVNFPPNSGVRVIAEPGTFYIRSAGHLVTNVIAKRLYKTIKDDKDVDKKDEVESTLQMYYLNVGIFNAFLGFLFDREYFDLPVPLKEKNDSSLRLSCIWGPSCDSSDVLFNRCMMPEMDAGDFVIFTDCGGYTDVISSDFNGYCIPPTCYIAPSQMRPVLERIFANTNTIFADEFVKNNTPVLNHQLDSIDIAR